MSVTYNTSFHCATEETFVHITYSWNIPCIKKYGLFASKDGLMGPAVYCCKACDTSTIKEVKELLQEIIDWPYVKTKSDEFNPGTLSIPCLVSVFFSYTGNYLYGENSDIAGYVAIPYDNIPPHFIKLITDTDFTEIDGTTL
ncbi:hypothetical protein YDYSY3_38550 [Paenibacillus chitinolyticus]|uniref:hypothetical protein n=1 Tax=Paenibacillus chitinolyticus TaxID=79263 RepID=UPI0026E4D7F3|nr:hypothetical protein [Paenibacillus chitinolyticus]GKS12855.1 hypothetical protein YDYSY3_38550 [Paenibacillus chitinolyticus]